ncbi:MAG TPA: RodZ domain-containing protein [Casimicrobiaceae bacterium]|nr:RodZ domain-containing protein [Casimicrobiaceae bacterium]
MNAPRTDPPPDANAKESVASARAQFTAGARLRAAREATGLSVDAVARQLKLAPRQVKALEDDDWQHLPGRTFVRGFARNYARFVQIDPDAVIALLPAPDAAPALERPALAASRRPMGEIPVERVTKPSAARWLVPLLIILIIAAVAYFQLARSSFHLPALLSSLASHDTESEPGSAVPATAATPGTGSSALPNPVAQPGAAPVAPGVPAASTDAGTPGNATRAVPGGAVTVLPTPRAADASAAAATTPASGGAAPAETPLVLTFKGTSWAEVKDAKGRVVLQMTGGAGMTQTISGVPPLELSLGNARDVDVTFRGQSLDLAPYTRGNVAHVSLQ